MEKEKETFGERLVKTYKEFITALDEYENDPHRNRHNFYERDESFEAFMFWLDNKYFK